MAWKMGKQGPEPKNFSSLYKLEKSEKWILTESLKKRNAVQPTP
jgi:hypothetical protein